MADEYMRSWDGKRWIRVSIRRDSKKIILGHTHVLPSEEPKVLLGPDAKPISYTRVIGFDFKDTK